jgi:hypothetical protein
MRLMKYVYKSFVVALGVETKPLKDIRSSKVAKLQLRFRRFRSPIVKSDW